MAALVARAWHRSRALRIAARLALMALTLAVWYLVSPYLFGPPLPLNAVIPVIQVLIIPIAALTIMIVLWLQIRKDTRAAK